MRGAGALCMNCHQSRSGSYTNSLVGYPLGRPTYAGGSSSFGPHDNPASDMLEGVNGYTYGQVIPSSAHRVSVTDTCAGCHMQTVASTDPAFTKAGGHTFSMTYSAVANGVTNTVDKVDVCTKCHGQITSFDMIKVDYNGDGLIEGVQTEVQKLLRQTLHSVAEFDVPGGWELRRGWFGQVTFGQDELAGEVPARCLELSVGQE